MKSYTQNAKRQ